MTTRQNRRHSEPDSQQLLEIYEENINNLDDPDEIGNDVILVLCTRNSLERSHLSDEQQRRLDRLDDELVARQAILAEVLPLPVSEEYDRTYWWWHLGEGPQVRQQAAAGD